MIASKVLRRVRLKVFDPITSGLKAASEQSLYAFPVVTLAGVLSSVGPCVAPRFIAAAGIAAQNDAKRAALRVGALVGGIVTAYAAFGAFAPLLRHVAHFSGAIYAVLALGLGLSGVIQLVRGIPPCSETNKHHARVGGAFFLGTSFAFVVSPCCTPLLIAIVAYRLAGRKPIVWLGAARMFRLGARVAAGRGRGRGSGRPCPTTAESVAHPRRRYGKRNAVTGVGSVLCGSGMSEPFDRRRRMILAGVTLIAAAFLFKGQVAQSLITRGDDDLYRGASAASLVHYSRAMFFEPASELATDRFIFSAMMRRTPESLRAGVAAATRFIRRRPNDTTVLADRALCYLAEREYVRARYDFAAAARSSRDPRRTRFRRLGRATKRRSSWRAHLLAARSVDRSRVQTGTAGIGRAPMIVACVLCGLAGVTSSAGFAAVALFVAQSHGLTLRLTSKTGVAVLLSAAAIQASAPLVLRADTVAAAVILVSALAVSAITDAQTGYIFDAVLATAVLPMCFASALTGNSEVLFAGVATGAGIMGVLFAATKGRGIGLGDVKMAACIGAALGAKISATAFGVAFVSGGAVATYLLATGKGKRGESLRFAPYLAGGVLFALPYGVHQ